MSENRRYNYPHSEAFGSLVAALRHERRLSSTDFARMIGVDRATLRRVEMGETAVTLERAAAIADAFELPLARFVATADRRVREARERRLRYQEGA